MGKLIWKNPSNKNSSFCLPLYLSFSPASYVSSSRLPNPCVLPHGPGPHSPALCSPLPLPVRVIEFAPAAWAFSVSHRPTTAHSHQPPQSVIAPKPTSALSFAEPDLGLTATLSAAARCWSGHTPLGLGIRRSLLRQLPRTPSAVFEIHPATILS